MPPGRRPTITQEEVDNYVHHSSRKTFHEKECKRLRGELLPKFRKDASISADGPFLLEYQSVPTAQPDWKGKCYELLQKYCPKTADEVFATIEASWEKEPVERILTVPNPHWGTSS